jgi:NAD(P)H-flavin reductase/ferredoxin
LSKLSFAGKVFDCVEGETVLDALLRNGIEIPFSCKSGICQTCLLRSAGGTLPPEAQKGLKDTLVAQNYFLACSCRPDQDLDLHSPDTAEVFGRAIIRAKERLGPDLYKLELEPANALYYHAGQFINLRNVEGIVRSYSLASVPKIDTYLEIHIKHFKNGNLTNWIVDKAAVGDEIDVQGPMGNCFYLPGKINQSLLLVGTGTGLAPLIGIARDALNSGHLGEIYLYHGSRHIQGLYLQEELHELTRLHANFHYRPCLSGDKKPDGFARGRANDIALAQQKTLQDWRVYLCGEPAMVAETKKLAYLAGAQLSDIYADPFVLKELRKKSRQ